MALTSGPLLTSRRHVDLLRAVDVAGQALVPTIVAERERILDEEQYASASVGRTPRPEPGPVAA